MPVVTPRFDLDPDTTLGGANASDEVGATQKAVKDYVDNGVGANKDLSNLTSQGKNIANWSNNITNCITEIPQDIKLELNNGTLTLKAGSKIYVPNGVGVFDTRVFTQDVSVSSLGSTTGKFLLTYGQSAWASQETFDYFHISQMNLFSGPSQPTVTSTNNMWYDTTNNVIKTTSNTGSTWTVTNNTFPFCIVTTSSGTITSIDQVFNGFGYIGSTVFALPDVKGLIPNGRNDDGTLKSTEFTITKVLTFTNSTGSATYRDAVIRVNEGRPGLTRNIAAYDEVKNYNHDTTLSGAVVSMIAIAGMQLSNGVISGFNLKTAFHAVGYNDSPTISGWSMPSSRYIDLTLGADGSTYTALANGFLLLNKVSSASGQRVLIQNTSASDFGVSSYSSSSGQHLESFSLGQKGDVFVVRYTTGGATNIFRFVYAEGENV